MYSYYATKNRYQLISPILSNKIYTASTLKGGARKCYQCLKSLNRNYEYFTIMDIDSMEKYDFKINKKNHANYTNQNNNQHNNQQGGQYTETNINVLLQRINELEKLLEISQKKVLEYEQQMDKKTENQNIKLTHKT